jgi:hypothetical protein
MQRQRITLFMSVDSLATGQYMLSPACTDPTAGILFPVKKVDWAILNVELPAIFFATCFNCNLASAMSEVSGVQKHEWRVAPDAFSSKPLVPITGMGTSRCVF